MIFLKIDLNKVDMSRIFNGQNGARYLDLVLKETPNGKFGNTHMIVQSVSAEERQQGVKGPIVGNGKAHTPKAGNGWRRDEEGGGRGYAGKAQGKPQKAENLDEDVPFN